MHHSRFFTITTQILANSLVSNHITSSNLDEVGSAILKGATEASQRFDGSGWGRAILGGMWAGRQVGWAGREAGLGFAHKVKKFENLCYNSMYKRLQNACGCSRRNLASWNCGRVIRVQL